jgi:hypothetical protein
MQASLLGDFAQRRADLLSFGERLPARPLRILALALELLLAGADFLAGSRALGVVGHRRKPSLYGRGRPRSLDETKTLRTPGIARHRPGTSSHPKADYLALPEGAGAHTGAQRNAPDRIRTCDLRFRRPTLYPTELQARVAGWGRRTDEIRGCGAVLGG